MSAARASSHHGSRVRVVRFGPTRPWFPPGSQVAVDVELAASQGMRARLLVDLMDLDRSIGRVERDIRLSSGRSRRRLEVSLPDAARRGYGLQLTVVDDDGQRLAVGSSAVEGLEGWWESPRHAALTSFISPDATAAAVLALRDWHVTVVQAYDWMYRHYRYAPPRAARLPGDAFFDSLRRRVSHAAVRAGLRAGHAAGIATLAYGSVYGAEAEYVNLRPDERVFDSTGQPISLGGKFFINDIRPSRPWRRRLLAEYAGAIRHFGFDGVHMDTYGPPHHAIAADGARLDFAALYPGLIADAAAVVTAARPEARVLFNCVEGFPLDAVADAPAAAIYLELWPPDERYADIVRWVDRARSVGRGRAIVIAAYLSCLRDAGDDRIARAAAVEAVLLLTSVITASGAYHHVLADGDRVLVEGYYPEARKLRQAEAAPLRAAWAFSARYVHLLSEPAAVSEPIAGLELLDGRGDALALSATPAAGVVWAQARRLPGGMRVLNLIDLRAQPDDRWDARRAAVGSAVAWRVRWPGARNLVAMSPWADRGRAQAITPDPDGFGVLPPFRRWVVIADRAAGS